MKATIFLMSLLFMLVGIVAAQQVYMGGGGVTDVFEGQLQIKGGAPALDKVLTSDAVGLATWKLAVGGGITGTGTDNRYGLFDGTTILEGGLLSDDGTKVVLKVNTPGTVGSHAAGQLIIQSPVDNVNANAVITGYESDGAGNPDQQLWYFGSSSSSNPDIIILNRRTGGHVTILTTGTGQVRLGNATGDVAVVNDIFSIKSRSSAPAGVSLGYFYIDSDLNLPCFHNGTNWVQMDDFTTVCS